VLEGDESEELADWLAEATALWRSWADQVAKHLVTLEVPPTDACGRWRRTFRSNGSPTGGFAPTTLVD
jgi:hypothetical protein